MIESQIIEIVLIFTVLLIVIGKLFSREKRTHIWRFRSAKRAFHLLQTFQDHGQIINYLRKLDPFVFEELLLIAIAQNKSCKVIRNKNYTGDGGIDGRFIYATEDNQKYLYIIQAKRYSTYINNQDVLEFSKKTHEEKAHRGLFIHTGRSGRAARRNMHDSYNIKIISGSKLVSLIRYGFLNEG